MSGAIADRLWGKRRAHLDSMTLIYFIERHKTYQALLRPLFERIDGGEIAALSSCITLAEVLVRPIRARRFDLVRQYKDTLVRARNFRLLPVDGRIAEAGAEIRAQFGFRMPDALQLATALRGHADIYVTNDQALKRFETQWAEGITIDNPKATFRDLFPDWTPGSR